MDDQVKPDRDRDPVLHADLIASVFGVEAKSTVDPELVSEVRRELFAERPRHDQLDTVNFQRLDDENDWTDV